MLERFRGTEGARRLLDALLHQEIVMGDETIARRIADATNLVHFEKGETLIEQGANDNDIFFILAGAVAIVIHGAEIAVRSAGTQVGEMAAIDPSAPRSASVIALEPVAAARLHEPQLVSIAEACPVIWRRLATQLSTRLRERTRFIRVANRYPYVFVGSSREMLPVANAIQAALRRDDLAILVWTDGIFRASRDAITNLLAAAERADFAVLVVGPDDVTIFRGSEQPAPRDNVIFELGLFIGAVGRDRTFVVKPRGPELRLPTDLLGLEPIQFMPGDDETLAERIQPVCAELRGYVDEMGVR